MFRYRLLAAIALVSLVGACAQLQGPRSPSDAAPAISPGAPAPPPPAAARTAEQFDTTTEEQRAAAVAAPSGAETRLGETIASLGDPTEPGLWVKTPLVTSETSGRIEYPGSGKSARVELRPSGRSGGGSQVSLAAMRLVEAPLTDLPSLVVYRD